MEQKEFISSLKTYWPLIALVIVSALAACAITHGINGFGLQWMHYFMGILFCMFALLKIFDVESFADGFQMYDLVAKQSRVYALVYPFIELALGLAYLSFFMPILTYTVTVIFMVIGIVGVSLALRKGLNTMCACMGSVLKVPLSTVTLAEDIGMGIMALAMLFTNLLL